MVEEEAGSRFTRSLARMHAADGRKEGRKMEEEEGRAYLLRDVRNRSVGRTGWAASLHGVRYCWRGRRK